MDDKVGRRKRVHLTLSKGGRLVKQAGFVYFVQLLDKIDEIKNRLLEKEAELFVDHC